MRPPCQIGAKIRPNCLCPFAALIYLNAFRPAENRNPPASEGAPTSEGFSERPGSKGKHLWYISIARPATST